MKSSWFKLCFFICSIISITTEAQLGQNKESRLGYDNEYSLGAMVHTNGFGVNGELLHFRHDGNYQLIDLNFYSISHPKETSQPNPDNQQSRSYVFGKLNNFYALSAAYGSRIVIAEKWTSTNVKVNFNYSFGPVGGLLKPVYYEVQSLDPNGSSTFERFNPNDDNQHARIIGTDFWRGFNQITFLYGGHAKTSMSFEWGPSETKYLSLETGLIVDVFPVEVPIFAYINNQRVFINMFLVFSFGKRY